ncbi:MAG TPA: recombination mediator RecR [Chitinophagales bacterium]|nr:recombination mediator RecR [Chitinophagales bacterium]HNL83872.1 recombination mediator RecR [Chitinophagales bacterium]
MQFPSRLIEDAVNAFAKLPGIGKKSALRMVVYLLQKETADTEQIAQAILRMRKEIQFCEVCHNVSDAAICSVCGNPHRDKSTICIVENFRDIIAIENTKNYNGVYHVLEGLISPIDGIGPDKLNIAKLMERVQSGEVKEIIMALNPTLDGDTTIFYLSKQLAAMPIKITTIARGISFGGELEYVDEITLSRSIQARLPYERYMSR